MCLHADQHEEDNISPAKAVFATTIVLTGQFLDPNANVNQNECYNIFVPKLWVLPKAL
jgi:hypothetical protein